MTHPTLSRRLLAECLGTALLVTAVVGSGIMASQLSPNNVGLQLLQNSIATAFALGTLILTFGPVSGAHLNPAVSAADWLLGRRAGTGLTARQLAGYVLAQTGGAITGSILANLMFALPAVEFSTKHRAAGHLWLGELVATLGLILLIFALARSGRAAVAPAAVGAYIGAPTGSPPPPRSPTRRSPSAGRSPTPSPASHPPRSPDSSSPNSPASLSASGSYSPCIPASNAPPTTSWSRTQTPNPPAMASTPEDPDRDE
jgi:hypothetical protein